MKRHATPPSALTVLAYDHSGHTRCSHEVEPGDIVEWKRQGTRGAYRCEVQSAWRAPSGRTMLLVILLSHDGTVLGERPIKKITGRHILAVYKRDGERKEPARQ